MVILEASDYVSVDTVPPFTGHIMIDFCSIFESAEATKILKEYMNVIICMYKNVSSPGWTKSKLKNYKLCSSNSRDLLVKFSTIVSHPRWATRIWHTLGYSCVAIREAWERGS